MLMAKHSVMDGSVVDVMAPVDEFITNIRRNGWWIHTDVEVRRRLRRASFPLSASIGDNGPHALTTSSRAATSPQRRHVP